MSLDQKNTYTQHMQQKRGKAQSGLAQLNNSNMTPQNLTVLSPSQLGAIADNKPQKNVRN